MNKVKVFYPALIAGGILSLFISAGTQANQNAGKFENYSKVQPARIAGETEETLRAYKQGCPECVLVAKDVAAMRQQSCADRNASIDSSIIGDPVYAYLNGVRMVLSTRGGYYSPLYTSARQIVEANVDCVNAQSWVDRSQKVLTQTFNNGKPLG